MKYYRIDENPRNFRFRNPSSVLSVSVPPFEFEIRFSGPISSRGRRTFLLVVYRHLRKLLGELRGAIISHAHRDRYAHLFPPRPLSFRETPNLNTPAEKAGYVLRLQRHRNRLTLRELSEISGVNLGHLSDIERGKHIPTKWTTQRIEQALARFEEQGVTYLSTSRTRNPKKIRKTPWVAKKHQASQKGWDLSEMYRAQQSLGASKIDSDPSQNA
jgi:transcriptional regulator with XRE-family HTH domain